MAHTSRRSKDTRRHSVLYDVGTKIGMRVNGEVVEGVVGSTDAGGWIYPNWSSEAYSKASGQLPGYCRSTHVFPLDERTVPSKKFLIH